MPADAKVMLKNFCTVLNVKEEDVLSMTRLRNPTDARYILVTFLKNQFKGSYSFNVIGKWFNRSHCFVIEAEKKVNNLMSVDKEFRAKYRKCEDIAFFFDLSIYNYHPQY